MRFLVIRAACGLALAAACASPAVAQSDDPLAFDPDAEGGPSLSWFSDLLIRGDYARDLPQSLPDERRGLARMRAGLRWLPDDAWELGAAIEASRGSDSAQVVRLAHDNQRINDLNVDLLYARWRGEHTALILGKHPLPLELTPMLWDDELRPVGVSLEHGIPTGDFDRIVLSGGAWLGDHLYGDTSRIVAVQAGWRLREGAPTGGGILLSLLDFDDLERIASSGLARSNRRIGNELVSDFQLLDLQLYFDTQLAGQPLRSRIDLVRNLGADDQRDGARGSVVWGDARIAQAWELGLAYQRVQRDAVMAAFNSEEWWFHSAMRGAMPWVGYGFDATWRIQLAVFLERADGRSVDTERALLDLRARW
jgi:hypothetical protein